MNRLNLNAYHLPANHCIVCDAKLLPQGQCRLECLQRKLEVEKMVSMWLQLIAMYGTTEL